MTRLPFTCAACPIPSVAATVKPWVGERKEKKWAIVAADIAWGRGSGELFTKAVKSLGKESDFQARHVHVVGAGVMGGDIAAWCAMRGLRVTLQDQSAERLAPAMKRAGQLFQRRLRDANRVRDAFDRLVPDTAGEGARRADVIIEAIFENLEAKRARYESEYALSPYQAALLTESREKSEFFEAALAVVKREPKLVANWVNGELASLANSLAGRPSTRLMAPTPSRSSVGTVRWQSR